MPDRELNEQERYDTVSDTLASWALSGLLPTSEDLRLARAYVAGTMTLEQILAETRARYPQVT